MTRGLRAEVAVTWLATRSHVGTEVAMCTRTDGPANGGIPAAGEGWNGERRG